jgi:hypothetical protein
MVNASIVSALLLKQIKAKSFSIALNLEYHIFLLMLQKLGLAMVTHINKTGLDVLAYNLQFIN